MKTEAAVSREGQPHPQIIPMLVDYYLQGRLPVERLIRTCPFEDIGQAFRDAGAREAIKPVLRMAV